MEWSSLVVVLLGKKRSYVAWLLANIGGIAIAYTASGTIWFVHLKPGDLLPRPEVFLIAGAISLAVSGVSYVSLSRDRSIYLSSLLSYSWPFLLSVVYGVFITPGFPR